jgi:hypothetical protein
MPKDPQLNWLLFLLFAAVGNSVVTMSPSSASSYVGVSKHFVSALVSAVVFLRDLTIMSVRQILGHPV